MKKLLLISVIAIIIAGCQKENHTAQVCIWQNRKTMNSIFEATGSYASSAVIWKGTSSLGNSIAYKSFENCDSVPRFGDGKSVSLVIGLGESETMQCHITGLINQEEWYASVDTILRAGQCTYVQLRTKYVYN
jgi:hypothetical protein